MSNVNSVAIVNAVILSICTAASQQFTLRLVLELGALISCIIAVQSA